VDIPQRLSPEEVKHRTMLFPLAIMRRFLRMTGGPRRASLAFPFSP
jgi:hypothetical protein